MYFNFLIFSYSVVYVKGQTSDYSCLSSNFCPSFLPFWVVCSDKLKAVNTYSSSVFSCYHEVDFNFFNFIDYSNIFIIVYPLIVKLIILILVFLTFAIFYDLIPGKHGS